jgi:hypothetical protein
MITGISAVAVRLMQVNENGEKHIIAEPKGPAQTEFYKNGFFRVEGGEMPGRVFFLFDTGEEIWADTPEEALSTVNARIKERHH